MYQGELLRDDSSTLKERTEWRGVQTWGQGRKSEKLFLKQQHIKDSHSSKKLLYLSFILKKKKGCCHPGCSPYFVPNKT